MRFADEFGDEWLWTTKRLPVSDDRPNGNYLIQAGSPAAFLSTLVYSVCFDGMGFLDILKRMEKDCDEWYDPQVCQCIRNALSGVRYLPDLVVGAPH